MSDLIDREALLESLIYCQGLGRKSCELVVTTINNQPTVSEQEIRNKAIDTFMIAIETLVKLHGPVVLSEIQEIAEQMKGVGE